MPSNTVWVVSVSEKDPENGNITVNNTPNYVYATFDVALTEAENIYKKLLDEYELQNNNACTDEGDAIPGGCGMLVDEDSESAEATIWDYLECENNALSERAVITVTSKSILFGRCEFCGEEILADTVSVEYSNKKYHEECFANIAYKLLLESGEAKVNYV